jgi:phage terminase small subunit
MATKQLNCSLSDRRAAFAEAYARHHNASQAAREAGYAQGCASVTGTRLLANASVLERVRELEAQTAVDMGISRQRMLLGLQEAVAMARVKRDPGAMIAAWREIGKACGFFAPEMKRVSVSAAGEGVQARIEAMSDTELMALLGAGASSG